MTALVVGIGHPFRHDDAIGLLVAEAVAAQGLDDVTVLTHHGEGSDLMARWQGFDRVVLIDATRSGGVPGCVRFWDDPALVPATCFPKSSHVFGVAEALALAATLGQLPLSLRVIGIEGDDFSAGEGVGPLLRAAIEPARRLVVDFLQA